MTSQSLVELLREAAHSIACQVDPEDELVRQLRFAANELEKSGCCQYGWETVDKWEKGRPKDEVEKGDRVYRCKECDERCQMPCYHQPKNRQKKIEKLNPGKFRQVYPGSPEHDPDGHGLQAVYDNQSSNNEVIEAVNKLIDSHNQRLEDE